MTDALSALNSASLPNPLSGLNNTNKADTPFSRPVSKNIIRPITSWETYRDKIQALDETEQLYDVNKTLKEIFETTQRSTTAREFQETALARLDDLKKDVNTKLETQIKDNQDEAEKKKLQEKQTAITKILNECEQDLINHFNYQKIYREIEAYPSLDVGSVDDDGQISLTTPRNPADPKYQMYFKSPIGSILGYRGSSEVHGMFEHSIKVNDTKATVFYRQTGHGGGKFYLPKLFDPKNSIQGNSAEDIFRNFSKPLSDYDRIKNHFQSGRDIDRFNMGLSQLQLLKQMKPDCSIDLNRLRLGTEKTNRNPAYQLSRWEKVIMQTLADMQNIPVNSRIHLNDEEDKLRRLIQKKYGYQANLDYKSRDDQGQELGLASPIQNREAVMAAQELAGSAPPVDYSDVIHGAIGYDSRFDFRAQNPSAQHRILARMLETTYNHAQSPQKERGYQFTSDYLKSCPRQQFSTAVHRLGFFIDVELSYQHPNERNQFALQTWRELCSRLPPAKQSWLLEEIYDGKISTLDKLSKDQILDTLKLPELIKSSKSAEALRKILHVSEEDSDANNISNRYNNRIDALEKRIEELTTEMQNSSNSQEKNVLENLQNLKDELEKAREKFRQKLEEQTIIEDNGIDALSNLLNQKPETPFLEHWKRLQAENFNEDKFHSLFTQLNEDKKKLLLENNAGLAGVSADDIKEFFFPQPDGPERLEAWDKFVKNHPEKSSKVIWSLRHDQVDILIKDAKNLSTNPVIIAVVLSDRRNVASIEQWAQLQQHEKHDKNFVSDVFKNLDKPSLQLDIIKNSKVDKLDNDTLADFAKENLENLQAINTRFKDEPKKLGEIYAAYIKSVPINSSPQQPAQSGSEAALNRLAAEGNAQGLVQYFKQASIQQHDELVFPPKTQDFFNKFLENSTPERLSEFVKECEDNKNSPLIVEKFIKDFIQNSNEERIAKFLQVFLNENKPDSDALVNLTWSELSKSYPEKRSKVSEVFSINESDKLDNIISSNSQPSSDSDLDESDESDKEEMTEMASLIHRSRPRS